MDDKPSVFELIEALEAPGLLRDQPAVQRLLDERRPTRPTLTLIHGGANEPGGTNDR